MPLIITLTAVIIPLILLKAGYYGSFLFSFSIPILWQVVIKKKSISTLGLKHSKLLKAILLGLISGICLSLVGVTLLKNMGLSGFTFAAGDQLHLNFHLFSLDFALNKEVSYRLLQNSHTPAGLAIYYLFNILLVGLGEEMLWRAFIQQKVKEKTKKHLAIILTSLGFALFHFYLFAIMSIPQGIIFLSIIGLTGLIWGYLYEYCDNLWAPAISHGIVAASIWKYAFFQI